MNVHVGNGKKKIDVRYSTLLVIYSLEKKCYEYNGHQY